MNSVNRFISKVRHDVEDATVPMGTFIMSPTKQVRYWDKSLVGGYFLDNPLRLAVATGKPFEKWFPVVVHEYGHFTQWRDKCPEHIRYTDEKHEGVSYGTLLWLWMDGINYPEDVVKKAVEISRDIEEDCERRAIKLIEEHDLPIEIEDYSKRAAAYVHFYNYIGRYRKWYKAGREPYNTPEVLDYLPSNFEENDFSETPQALFNIFDDKCL